MSLFSHVDIVNKSSRKTVRRVKGRDIGLPRFGDKRNASCATPKPNLLCDVIYGPAGGEFSIHSPPPSLLNKGVRIPIGHVIGAFLAH